MIYELSERRIIGVKGSLLVPPDDEITPRLLMLIEGECEGLGRSRAAEKYGITRQRYHQLLAKFMKEGSLGLENQKRGPKAKSVRNDEIDRRVIRQRFIDRNASVDAIAEKLSEAGINVSARTVERIIEDYGLQKHG